MRIPFPPKDVTNEIFRIQTQNQTLDAPDRNASGGTAA